MSTFGFFKIDESDGTKRDDFHDYKSALWGLRVKLG